MSETDAKNRYFIVEMFYDIHADSRLFRTFGTRGEHNALRLHIFYLPDRNGIVAHHPDVRREGSDILIEVIGKGIIVVNQ